jgi:DinB superfamily
MLKALDVLLANLDSAYDRKSWHGTTLRGSIRGLATAEAWWRPAAGRHNIWELTAHAAYWKYAVRRRLRGGKRGSFAIKGSNWFPAPAAEDENSWGEVVALLDAEHRALRDAVAGLRPRALDQKTAMLVYGVAAHDLYHAGQIQLIKRLGR